MGMYFTERRKLALCEWSVLDCEGQWGKRQEKQAAF